MKFISTIPSFPFLKRNLKDLTVNSSCLNYSLLKLSPESNKCYLVDQRIWWKIFPPYLINSGHGWW